MKLSQASADGLFDLAASVTAKVTATTPHQDSPWLTATAANRKMTTSHQVAALN
jgi:hypothetical protein